MEDAVLQLSPKGSAFVRCGLALACERDSSSAILHAVQRWGSGSQAANVLRAVAAATTADEAWAGLTEPNQAAIEFVELVKPQTILGKLSGLRVVPANISVVTQSGAATAYWVGEGLSKPPTTMVFEREALVPQKVAALLILSEELARSASPRAETMIRGDLMAALVEAGDVAFINPANAGQVGVLPASITNGVTPISSAGNLADDVEAALAAFEGNLSTAAWVLHPRLAAQAGVRSGGKGIGVDLGARGGSLAGLPAITSEAVPFDSDGGSMLVLVDASAVVVVDEGAAIRSARHATLDMAGGDAPTFNLWQRNSVAILVERSINWKVARAGAVVAVEGANYGAES